METLWTLEPRYGVIAFVVCLRSSLKSTGSPVGVASCGVITAVSLTLWLLLCGASLCAAPADKPNVILFHSHDFGQYLHCYGVKTVQTPNLDRFAQQGVRFARAFCMNPGCSPSRASLFTGRYPHNNGVMGLTHSQFGWDLHPEEKHMAQFLKEAGYETVGIGVIHETRSGPERCGYMKYFKPTRAAAGVSVAIEELKRLGTNGRPFFLCAGFGDTHRPFATSKPDRTLGVEVPGYLRATPGTIDELAALQGAMLHLDTQFGRLVRSLHELGLETNTLLIVTTDHGIPMPRAKCSVHDPGLQVALLLRYPARKGWSGGVVRNELISNIDVLPSILEVAGLSIPQNIQGRSFAPLLDGRSYTPNREVFGELTYHNYYDPERSIRTETHKLIAYFSSAPAFMDPSQQWRPPSDPAEPGVSFHPYLEVYDLNRDPWEMSNLADKAQYAELRTQLARRLYEHMVQTEDPLLRGAVTSPQHDATLRLLQGDKSKAR
jgi:N-sulfoglucosamine sulfohydrolase